MNKENVRETLKEIYESLKKGNYDPLSQIVGYLTAEIQDMYLLMKMLELKL